MDLISNLLRTFHLNSNVFKHARFCGQWSLDTTGSGYAGFHLVADGQCWLHRPDGTEPMLLRSGDLLILPRDAPHVLSDSPVAHPGAAADMRPLGDRSVAGTDIVCGFFQFDDDVANPLLDVLPDYLVIHSDAPGTGAMRRIVELLVSEAAEATPGVDAVLDRLSDALFIQAIRAYLRTATGTGLAAALADPAVHAALRLMHESPGRDWTMAALARDVAVSRSSFAQRFAAALGEPPMAYLARWRMTLARRLLREWMTVAEVAERCGYESEAGFAKAFKRVTGTGPGAVRQAGRLSRNDRR
jgi:AraC-like DNA-binding protein